MNSAILYITALITVIKSLELIYHYQLKEYRLDRFSSMLDENGFFQTLYTPNLRLPAKKLRNILLMLFVVLKIIGFIYILIPLIQNSTLLSVFILLISPILSLIYVSFGVIITKPLAHFVRQRTVERAKIKLQAMPNLIRIGVSGSYGKTSVKEIMAHILSSEAETAKTSASMNTDVGVAQSILNKVHSKTKYFVAEVAAYKRHEVERACEVFNPQHAIITQFGNQHLSLYGSKKTLIESESEIVPMIPNEGFVVVNRDAEEFEYLSSINHSQLKTYSLRSADADIYAKDIKSGPKGTSSRIYLKTTKGRSYTLKTKLLGTHSIQNILPCILLAYELGLPMNKILQAVESLEYVPGKLSVTPLKDPDGRGVVINDSSNSSLHGFLAAIDVLSRFPQDKKVIVSKGIIELGKEKQKSYNMIIEQLEKSGVVLVTTDDSFKKYGLQKNCIIRRNEEEIELALNDVIDDNTALLLEGKFTPQFVNKYII